MAEEAKPLPVPAASAQIQVAPSNTASPAIDFETYQRNIDDIYQIALMSSPNVDSGINNVIVNLNRKIAENPSDADSLMNLGHVYRILGQPREANRFYRKALKLDPDNFHLNVFAGLQSAQDKDLDQAIEKLSAAIEKNPMDYYAWMARARVYMMKHEYEKAALDFEKVLEIQPESRQAALALSLVYQQLGQNQKALEILETLRAKNPANPLIRYHIGALLMAQKKTDQTIQYWEGLFKDGVRDVQFLFNLAAAYLRNGDGSKAQNILIHLNFMFPRQRDVDFLMAEAYRQTQLYEDAEREYRLLLAEDPYYLSAYVGLAQTLDLQGKSQERQKVIEQAELFAQEAEEIQFQREQARQTEDLQKTVLSQFPDAHSR